MASGPAQETETLAEQTGCAVFARGVGSSAGAGEGGGGREEGGREGGREGRREGGKGRGERRRNGGRELIDRGNGYTEGRRKGWRVERVTDRGEE